MSKDWEQERINANDRTNEEALDWLNYTLEEE
jgi:hypothetical protein